jgi:hypothetical protein
MNSSDFLATIQTIPYRPNTQDATGLLPPIVRSMGHILYTAAAIANAKDNGPTLTAEEIHNEFNHAKEHLNATEDILAQDILSELVKTYIKIYKQAITDLNDAWEGWSVEDQLYSIMATANAAVALAAALDRELTGFTRSDPGFNL